MSLIKPVTPEQGKAVVKMGNEKGVGRERFQTALDNGSFARFLDGLKVDLTTIQPPKGARLHTVRVKVKLDREWQEAVNLAGPNTPPDYNVRKAGDLYVPTGMEEIEEDLILLNFPKGDGYEKAVAWAKSVGLKNTVPREVFAIGEQHPKLHEQLGFNPMWVAATTECTFGGDRRACYVWWSDSGREASLHWVGLLHGSNIWFAFRK